MRRILLFLLFPFFLLAQTNYLNNYKNLIANSLYNLDSDQAEVVTNLFFKQNPKVLGLKVIDNTDGSVFLEAYRDKDKVVFDKLPEIDGIKLQGDINYQHEKIGKVTIYIKDNSFLSREEKKWIKNHIVIIGTEDWKPIVFSNDGKDLDGLVGDFTKLIIKKTGLKTKVVTGLWNELVIKFKNKQIDILPATFYTKERAKYGLFSKGYFTLKNYLYVKKSNNSIHSFKDLKNKKLAIIKGYGTIPDIKEKFPSIKIVETNSLDESIEKVLNGDVDALYDGEIVVEEKIKENLISGLKSIPQTTFPAKKLHYFVHDKTLLSIIQKALDHITPEERNKIYAKWLNSNKVNLSDEEIAWLKKHTLKYAYDPNWKPLEWADEIKEHKGIISDILKLIEQKSEIKIKPIYCKSWNDVLQKVKSNQANALTIGFSKLPYLNYTKPIIKTPYVFVTRIDEDYLNGFDDLKGKKVGVYKDSSIYFILKEKQPTLKLITFEDDQKAFKMVENKKLDVIIYNAITAKYYINQLGYKKVLKIAYKTPYTLELKIGVNKTLGDIPISILNKAITHLSKKDISDIIDKWTIIPIKKGIDWKLIIEISVVLLLIIAFMIWNNYRLNKIVQEKTKDLEERTQELELLSNSLELKVKEKTKALESEKKLINSIINSQDDIVVTSDGKKLTTANKAFYKFYKLNSIDEFVKKYGPCICDSFEKDVDFSQGYITKDMNGVSWIEYVLNHPNQLHKVIIENHIFLLHLDSFMFEGKKFITVVLSDITEVERQKNHLKKFFENRGVGILIVDTNRKIKEINDKFCEIWQYDKDEILGQPAEVLHISPETYKEFGEIAFSKISKNKPIDIEYQMKRKNGEIFWAKFSGELLSEDGDVLWIISDITELQKAKQKIEEMHKHTKESIEFASLIQHALIPPEDYVSKIFKDAFVFWQPKDIVGGDIYLFETLRNEDECLLMCIDCTGHGVPGAFVTMIVKAVEREIVGKIKDNQNIDVSPAWVLKYFNRTIKKLLKQEDITSVSNAGFDGGIIYYNRRQQILKYAGAETPLFYMSDKGLKVIKGDRHSVGYKKSDANFEFKEHILEVTPDMKFYITSDGYLDQNGGDKDFPFGKKRFKQIIEEVHELPMQEQKQVFIEKLQEYQKDNERNDDVTVIGFKIAEQSHNMDIFKYEGIITQNVIATALDNIESSVHTKLVPKISTIAIEYCQNMMNYSKDEIEGSREIHPHGLIHIEYLDSGIYKITAKNIISIEDKEKIEPKLKDIQSLDKAGIKKRYRELRKSGENTHEKGGGIGLYEIAKMSDEISYEFVSINKDKFYFIMTTIVNEKK